MARPLLHTGRRAVGRHVGRAAPRPGVAVALSAIAVVTLTLSFLHYRQKPAGISVLDGTTSRSVWTQTRDSILTYSARGGGSPEVMVLRRLWDGARDGDTVAVRIRGDNVSYRTSTPASSAGSSTWTTRAGSTPTRTGSSPLPS